MLNYQPLMYFVQQHICSKNYIYADIKTTYMVPSPADIDEYEEAVTIISDILEDDTSKEKLIHK